MRPGSRAEVLRERDRQLHAAAVGLDRDAVAGRRLHRRVADVHLPRAGRVDERRADQLGGAAGRRAVVDADVVRDLDVRAAVDDPAALAVVLRPHRVERVRRRRERDLRRVAGRGIALRAGARVVRPADTHLHDDRGRRLRYRNVSFELVVSPLSATGVPLTCDHSNFAAPTEVEASSVSGRFCRTVAPTGAMTASVGLLALTVTSTESVRVWPLPVTVSVNDSLPADVGAVNVGVAVVPPVSVTPAGALQAMLSMSPAEPPPSSVTFAPCSTVWSTPASARSGRAARPAPSIATGTVTEPPLDDLTVTLSGGASVEMSTEPALPRALL